LAEKVAGGAKGFYILGLISEKKKKNKDALLYYKRSFKLDPSLWIAFEKICQLDIASTVSLTDLFSIRKTKKVNEEVLPRKPKKAKRVNPLHTPKKLAGKVEVKEKEPIPKKDLKRVKMAIVESGVESRKKKMEVFIMKNYGRNKMKKKPLGIDLKEKKQTEVATSEVMRNHSLRANLGLISKRSSPDASKSNSKSKDIRFLKIKKSRFEENTLPSEPNNPTMDKTKSCHMDLLKRYLVRLGYAYRMMTLGKFKESINIFNSLDSSMLKLHFVLINTAICYMHLVKYKSAEKIFNYAFEKEPYESYGLDFYR
jgi:tetratricopeptide (TPR) repeat protein